MSKAEIVLTIACLFSGLVLIIFVRGSKKNWPE